MKKSDSMKLSYTFFFCISCIMLRSQENFNRYFDEASTLVNSGDYIRAIEKFSKAIDLKDGAANNYRIADAYIFRGFCRTMLKSYDAGLKDINQGIQIKPEYVKGYYIKSQVLLGIKQYTACIQACDQGLKLKPGFEDLIYNKWEALKALKKYEEGKACLRLVLEKNPRSIEAIKYIGATCISQHYWDSASYYFSKAIEIDPTDLMSYYDRGISKSYLKDVKGAQEDIEKAMLMDTTSKFVGYNNLGFFLKMEEKKFDEAIVFFTKAIELKPDFAYAYSNRGFSKMNLGDMKGAYKDLEKSIELDKTNSYAFKNLGLIYLKDSKIKKACEAFSKSLELGYSQSYDDEVEKLIQEHCK
ncbi:MAG: hypothetical protein JNL60_08960 [Bacteroidia bacterium]|nr:hypothetical protein [Bacteroidia bacterium]